MKMIEISGMVINIEQISYIKLEGGGGVTIGFVGSTANPIIKLDGDSAQRFLGAVRAGSDFTKAG